MTAVIGFLKKRLVIQIAGIIALCVLIWFVGPKIAFAKKAPLAPEINRLLTILAVVVVWGVYSLIHHILAKKKEQQLMADLAAPQLDPAQTAIDEAQAKEAADLGQKFEYALQLLKKTRSKGWRDKQFIYELPWYVIIGAPGCGKTTLLANSGLSFPLSEYLEREDVPGVGGTRNCDWLFAEEAIFLDTAGRYTTQDSHQSVDAAAWQGFLDLVKRYRPRRPINGVLVAMSMSDLLRQTEEENRQHAAVVRKRILELFEVLGIRFPIYVVFTKSDLVAGFTDFFAQFSPEERAQVWGETFQADDAKQAQALIDRFIANYDGLLGRLNQRTFKKIQEERDIQRRSLILDFPQQMALLKPKIERFLQQTFSIGRYEKFKPLLRGVYLTSGTQEGTPIDRVMGMLAATYGLDRQQAPVFSGQGKSFFITRLLKEVIFPEAELAGIDPRVERRRNWLQMAAYGAVLALTAGFITLWSISFVQNKSAIGRIEKQIERYNKTVSDNTSWNAAVESLLNRLNAMQAANQVYEPHSFLTGFGLSQADKLQAGINLVYGQLLENNFLQLIKARLEQRIHARLYRDTEEDLAVLYELLKVYLMLEEPQKRLAPDLAARRINSDWKQSFTGQPEMQVDLSSHTASLLHLPLEPAQLNESLIKEARRILNTQPVYAQIFAHMRADAGTDSQHDFRLVDVLPPHSNKVFITADGQDLKALMIPGLFTYDGYHGFFKKKGLRYVQQALRENWVLNNYAADQESDLPRLYDDLQKLYFEQYAKQWRNLIDNLKVRKAQGLAEEIQILDILSGSESPLPPLLAAVERNTTLTRSPRTADSGSGAKPAGAAASAADRALEKSTASVHALALEKKFEDIHYLVRSSGDAPPPLDNVIAGLNDVRDFMMQIGSAADSDEKALEKALERIHGGGTSEQIKSAQMGFARQPEPFKSWFSSLTSSSMKFTLASAKSEINATWKSKVLAPYKAGLQGRYPIYKNSIYDVTFDDFARFFMPNGTIDQFFQNHLKDFIDTSRTKWRTRKIDNQAMKISPRVLRQLQYAAKIRDTFFASGTATPSVQFELKPVDLDNEIATFRINIEGQVAEYRHGPVRSKKFTWPGPDTNAGVRLTFKTVDGQEISHVEEGAWAWLKTLDKSVAGNQKRRDRFMVTFKVGNYKARYLLRASTVHHPFRLKELQSFRCPESF